MSRMLEGAGSAQAKIFFKIFYTEILLGLGLSDFCDYFA